MAALKKVLGGVNSGIDSLLMKSAAMRKKPSGFSVKDGVVAGGQPGLIKSEVDPMKKAALLSALGIGGAGLGAAALGGEEEDDDEAMGKLKSLLGL
jgi:hypothetical protein